LSDNKKIKTSKRDAMKRILSLVLVILMLLGTFSIALSFIIPSLKAEEFSDAPILRIGLMYGSGVTVGFETTTEYGVGIGIVDSDNIYTEIMYSEKTLLAAACDTNLINNNRNLEITYGEVADIGGYHVQIVTNIHALNFDLSYYGDMFYGIANVFPAYCNGNLYVRIGQFTSYSAAQDFLSQNNTLFGAEIVSPAADGVSLLDPLTNEIVFELSDPEMMLGTVAIQDEFDLDKEYITTPAKNAYDGIFAYRRHTTDTIDGVSVINVLNVETYIEGVIPSEVHNYWHLEALRSFAITTRTFAADNIGSHSKLKFDICNSSCCQVYRGRTNVNDAVKTAVYDTRGLIATYKGKPVKLGYSSVVGGVTVSAYDGWGSVGDYPYLDAKVTPWEKYEEYPNGSWTVEVSPDDLLAQLNKKGYTLLKGSIADVEIVELCTNSTYVKQLAVTDVFGTKVNIKFADNIRIALAAYVKSANFVVGFGGETIEQTEYILEQFDESALGQGFSVYTEEGLENNIDLSSMSVITANGTVDVESPQYISVITADGEVKNIVPDEFVFEGGVAELTGVPVKTVKQISLPGSNKNFVFVGKGWGHGIGLSQYGMLELAKLGYKYDDILQAYLPGTDISYMYTVNDTVINNTPDDNFFNDIINGIGDNTNINDTNENIRSHDLLS